MGWSRASSILKYEPHGFWLGHGWAPARFSFTFAAISLSDAFQYGVGSFASPQVIWFFMRIPLYLRGPYFWFSSFLPALLCRFCECCSWHLHTAVSKGKRNLHLYVDYNETNYHDSSFDTKVHSHSTLWKRQLIRQRFFSTCPISGIFVLSSHIATDLSKLDQTIMTTIFNNVRNYAQNYPLFVAAGLVIIVPGTYLYTTGRPPVLKLEHTLLSHSLSPTSDVRGAVSVDLTVTTSRLSKWKFPKSSWRSCVGFGIDCYYPT